MADAGSVRLSGLAHWLGSLPRRVQAKLEAGAGSTLDPATVDKSSTTMSGGLVLFTASLGAVGGLTGGVARMFRNGDHTVIRWSFGLILASVLLAVFARLLRHTWVTIVVLTLSMVSFGLGAFLGMNQMVASVKTQDRPSLAAQLSGDEAGWVLKVQASSGGLKAHQQLQLLVYAQSAAGSPIPTGYGPVPTPTASATDGTPAPPDSSSLVPAGRLKGIRLFFAQSGPDADGVATQTVEVPILARPGYHTVVVTANIGGYPRDCEGRAINIRDNTELLVPSEASGGRLLTMSCLTLALPQAPAATPSPGT